MRKDAEEGLSGESFGAMATITTTSKQLPSKQRNKSQRALVVHTKGCRRSGPLIIMGLIQTEVLDQMMKAKETDINLGVLLCPDCGKFI